MSWYSCILIMVKFSCTRTKYLIHLVEDYEMIFYGMVQLEVEQYFNTLQRLDVEISSFNINAYLGFSVWGQC